MNIYKFLLGLCLSLGMASLAAGSPLPAPADEKSPQTATDKNVANPSGYDLEIVDGKLVSGEGRQPASLVNVVEALRQRYPQANIVLGPGLATIIIPDLKLRAGRLEEELEALRIASGDKFTWHGSGGGVANIDPTTGQPVSQRDVERALFALEPMHRQNDRQVEAFNVGPYLEWTREHAKADGKDTSMEDNLRGIEEMILETLHRFSGDAEQKPTTDFKYYKDAHLFVMIGNPEAVEIARKIVNVLPGMAAIDNSAARHYGTAPATESPAMDAFRRRYGLGGVRPENQPPANPAGQPGSKK